MEIAIQHQSVYRYDAPLFLGLQRLKLTPATNPIQTVKQWQIELIGAQNELQYTDYLGNDCELVKLATGSKHLEINVHGTVITRDTSGVYGRDQRAFPTWFFKKQTVVTQPGQQLKELIHTHKNNDGSVSFFHLLSEKIRENVAYKTGTTTVVTNAEKALDQGSGVCQDHSHIMISLCRGLGYEARYVSGYLLMDDTVNQSATHAWCEVKLDNLGWVGFDVSNGYSPDERYVRVAIGRDYEDAAPIHGIRYGDANETLDVTLQIQQ